MKKIYSIIFLTIPILLFSQASKEQDTTKEEKKADEISVKIGGFIRFETYYDTYNSVTARDGVAYLYPSARSLDSLGNDINANNKLGMASFVSRFNFKINGPEILGAKSSGLLEADFYATQDNFVQLLRLRHAYITLDWGKFNLLAGQAFHPMFVSKCYPQVLTYAVGVPFGTLNRAPQLRGTFTPTKWFSIMGAALVHGYHKSKGPADAQKDAGIPDMQLQVMFSPKNFFVGATGGYKLLQPRLQTGDGVKTDETIGSYNLQGFVGFSANKFSIKAMGIFGENLTHLTMIGGYGASEDPALVDDYSYSNLQTYSYWIDVTVLKNPQIGIFGGVTGNLGSKDSYYSLGYARSETLVNTFRISPRIQYNIKNFNIGLEYLFAGSIYGESFNDHYKANTLADATYNNRVTLLMTYKF